MTRSEKILGIGVSVVFVMLYLSNILLLPPYEGFDETAHYSYVSILSDRYEIPDFRTTHIDAGVEKDLLGLPRPYSRQPPFQSNGGITYSQFFNETGVPRRKAAIQQLWRPPQEPATYIPGNEVNWQGQHPPLYYALLAVPYRMAKDWSPGMRLLLLRIVSVLIACGSLVFWLKTVRLFGTARTRQFLLCSGLVVTFFPSIYYNQARLGNDSLGALVFSAVLYFLLASYVHKHREWRDFWGLAIALGCGLLTKLFFVPVLLGTLGVTAWFGFTVTRLASRDVLARICLLVGVPLLLAGWWFVLFYVRYGVLIGSHEMYIFDQIPAPLGADLTTAQFLQQMLRAGLGFVTTFLWCGTWSFVRPPHLLYVCFVPLFLLTADGLMTLGKHKDAGEKEHILVTSILLIFPLLLSFLYAMYVRVLFTGQGFGNSGHYLFFTWPIIGMVFANTFEAGRAKVCIVLLFVAFACVMFFDVIGWWRSMQVYSGMVEKVNAIETGIGFRLPTPKNIALALGRLDRLVFPHWALGLSLAATLLRLVLVTWVIVALRSAPHPVRGTSSGFEGV